MWDTPQVESGQRYPMCTFPVMEAAHDLYSVDNKHKCVLEMKLRNNFRISMFRHFFCHFAADS